MNRFVIRYIISCLSAIILLNAGAELHAFTKGFAYGVGYENEPGGQVLLWRLDLEMNRVERLGPVAVSTVGGGFIDSRNNLLVLLTTSMDPFGTALITVDLESAAVRDTLILPGSAPNGMVFNPTDGKIYAHEKNDEHPNYTNLMSIDLASGEVQHFDAEHRRAFGGIRGMLDYVRGHYYGKFTGPGNTNNYAVFDISTGEMIDEISYEKDMANIVFDPAEQVFFGTAFTGTSENPTIEFVRFDPRAREETVLRSDLLDGQTVFNFSSSYDPVHRCFYLYTVDRDIRVFELNGELLKTLDLDPDLTQVDWLWSVYPAVHVASQTSLLKVGLNLDGDSDCRFTSSDYRLPYQEVRFQPGNLRVFSDRFGRVSAELQPGEYSYEFVGDEHLEYDCPINKDGQVSIVNTGREIQGENWLIGSELAPAAFELRMYAGEVTTAGDVRYEIHYLNQSLIPFRGTIRFEHEFEAQSFEASLPGSYENGVAELEVAELEPGKGGLLTITLRIDNVLGMEGRRICSRASMQHEITTVEATDHPAAQVCSVVGESRRANHVTVEPRGSAEHGEVAEDLETFDYTIYVQNESDVSKKDVNIRITLDEALDVNTLNFGPAPQIFRAKVSNGRTLELDLDNINLPPATLDAAASRAAISFSIDRRADLESGSEIKLYAAISMDGGKPQVTNEVRNTFGQHITSVAQEVGLAAGALSLRVFDAGDSRFRVRSAEPLSGKLQVFSVLGSKVLETSLKNQPEVSIDLGSQPSGRYLIRLESLGVTYFGTVAVLR